MSGIVTWFIFAKAAVLDPNTFFKELEVHGYGIPLTFSLLSTSIAAYLGAIAQIARYPVLLHSPVDLLFLLIYATLIGLVGGTFLVAGWSALMHASVYLFEDVSFQRTVVATTYATAVVGLLGWTPVLALKISSHVAYVLVLAILAYLTYLTVLGLHHQQGLSRTQAAIGGFTPIMVITGGVVALQTVDPALLDALIVLPEQIALHIFHLVT